MMVKHLNLVENDSVPYRAIDAELKKQLLLGDDLKGTNEELGEKSS